jgi:hypothetical protein
MERQCVGPSGPLTVAIIPDRHFSVRNVSRVSVLIYPNLIVSVLNRELLQSGQATNRPRSLAEESSQSGIGMGWIRRPLGRETRHL